MSQANLEVTAGTDTGLTLTDKLNAWAAAVKSCHSGAARPAYLVAGGLWIDTSAAGFLTLKLFDGASDVAILTVTTADHTLVMAAHGHAIADVTGLQAALDGKSATGHGHAIADVTGLQAALDAAGAETGTVSRSLRSTMTMNNKIVWDNDYDDNMGGVTGYSYDALTGVYTLPAGSYFANYGGHFYRGQGTRVELRRDSDSSRMGPVAKHNSASVIDFSVTAFAAFTLSTTTDVHFWAGGQMPGTTDGVDGDYFYGAIAKVG